MARSMPALFSKLCEGEGVIINCVEGNDRGCGELKQVLPTAVTAIHKAVLQSAGCGGLTSFISYLLVGLSMML